MNENAEADVPPAEKTSGCCGYSDGYPYEEYAYPEDDLGDIADAEASDSPSQDESRYDPEFSYEPCDDEFHYNAGYNQYQHGSQPERYVASEPVGAEKEGADASDAVAAAARVVDVILSLGSRSLTVLGGVVESVSRRFSGLAWGRLWSAGTEDRAAGRARAGDDPLQR